MDNILIEASRRKNGMDEFDIEAEKAGNAIKRINDFRPRYKIKGGKRQVTQIRIR